MQNPTNQQLAEKFDKKFEKIETAMVKGFKEVNDRINPIHDFMVGQQAVSSIKHEPSSKEQQLWDIIKWLILIVVAFAGIKLT